MSAEKHSHTKFQISSLNDLGVETFLILRKKAKKGKKRKIKYLALE